MHALIHQIHTLDRVSKWWKELVKGHETDVKFIFPSKKINYDKYEKGGKKKVQVKKNACSFNSIYVVYKMLKHNKWV